MPRKGHSRANEVGTKKSKVRAEHCRAIEKRVVPELNQAMAV